MKSQTTNSPYKFLNSILFNLLKVNALVLLLILSTFTFSQESGDYRTRASGNWTGNIWEMYNGSNWTITNIVPENANVEILHSVDVSTGGGSTNLNGNLTISKGDFTLINTNGNTAFTFYLSGDLTLNGGKFIFNNGNNSSGKIVLEGDLKLLSGEVTGGTRSNNVMQSGFLLNGSTNQTVEIGIPASSFTHEYLDRFFINSSSTNQFTEKYSGTSTIDAIKSTTMNIPSGYEAWPTSSGRLSSIIIDNTSTVNLTDNRQISTSLILKNGLLNLGEYSLTLSGNVVTTENGKINFNDSRSTLIFDNSSPIELPADLFHGAIQNLTISNSGGVNVNSDLRIEGVLNLDAENPNETDGLIDLVIDYGSYASIKYSTDSSGRLLTNYNSASEFLDNTSVYNRLNSYVLNMGPNSSTIGRGDVVGRIKRTGFISGKEYSFGNENMRLRFTSREGSALPSEVVVTVTKGSVHGIHPDKRNTTLPNAKDSLLGYEQVNRLYQVNRTGGESKTLFRVRFPYEQRELSINNESSLVTWDHHLPYVNSETGQQGLTPHEHGYTTRDAGENWVELDNHGLFYLAQEGDTDFTKYWMLGQQITKDTLWLGAAGGTAGTEWDVVSNWSSGVAPDADTRIVIPDTTVHTNPLIIKDGQAKNLRSIEISQSAKVYMEGNSTLSIFGGPTEKLGYGSWQNSGSLISSENSKVIFLYDNATISGKTTFNDLEVAEGASLEIQSNSEINLTGSLINNGTLDLGSNKNIFRYKTDNQKISNPNGRTPGYYDLHIEANQVSMIENITINNDFLVEDSGSFSTSNYDMEVLGNFYNHGSFTTETNNNIHFTGSYNQEIGGSNPTIFEGLTINKPEGNLHLANNINVRGNLSMLKGNIYSYYDSMLTIGTDENKLGSITHNSGFVYGVMSRWFDDAVSKGTASGLFPIGYNGMNRFIQVDYATAPNSSGTLTASWVEEMMGNAGLPFTVDPTNRCPPFDAVYTSQYGYWQVNDSNGLSGGKYDITLHAEGLGGISDICQLTTVKRVNNGDWQPNGVHAETTGDFVYPILKAEMAEGWSNWGIAGGSANPLPVELLSFTAKCNNNEVNISWTTASELNSAQFIIEKSDDGKSWEFLHKQEGAGISNSILHYELKEKFPTTSTIYYRLRQRDYDGKEEVFGPISASCKTELTDLNVFPNPSNNYFTVQVSSKSPAHEANIYIYNTSGQIVESRKIEINDGQNQFIFSNVLKSGTYIIRLESPNAKFKPFKLVVTE